MPIEAPSKRDHSSQILDHPSKSTPKWLVIASTVAAIVTICLGSLALYACSSQAPQWLNHSVGLIGEKPGLGLIVGGVLITAFVLIYYLKAKQEFTNKKEQNADPTSQDGIAIESPVKTSPASDQEAWFVGGPDSQIIKHDSLSKYFVGKPVGHMIGVELEPDPNNKDRDFYAVYVRIDNKAMMMSAKSTSINWIKQFIKFHIDVNNEGDIGEVKLFTGAWKVRDKQGIYAFQRWSNAPYAYTIFKYNTESQRVDMEAAKTEALRQYNDKENRRLQPPLSEYYSKAFIDHFRKITNQES